MSALLFLKCFAGISIVGSATLAPILYTSLKTTTNNPQTTVLTQKVQDSPERREKDRQHDDCLGKNIKVKIKSNSGETKEVTLAEKNKNYSDWQITDANYTPQCSRELS